MGKYIRILVCMLFTFSVFFSGCQNKGVQENIKQEVDDINVFCSNSTTFIVNGSEVFCSGVTDKFCRAGFEPCKESKQGEKFSNKFLPIASNILKLGHRGLGCYLSSDQSLHLMDSKGCEKVINNVSDFTDSSGGDIIAYVKDSKLFYVDINDLGEFDNKDIPIQIEGLIEGDIVDIFSRIGEIYVLYDSGDIRIIKMPFSNVKRTELKVINPYVKKSPFVAKPKRFVDSFYELGFGIIDENGTLYSYTYADNALTLEAENVRDAFYGEASKYYILNDGSLWGYGWNKEGQLGVGDTNYRDEYVKIMDGARLVSGGWSHVVVITEDNRIFGFGDNSVGQLSGEKERYYLPTMIRVYSE